jgi:hypothetical protein
VTDADVLDWAAEILRDRAARPGSFAIRMVCRLLRQTAARIRRGTLPPARPAGPVVSLETAVEWSPAAVEAFARQLRADLAKVNPGRLR